MPSIRRPIVLAAFVCCAAGLLAGSSLAYVCHPVSRVRDVTLPGSVVSLHALGNRADLRRQEHGGLVHPHRLGHATGPPSRRRPLAPCSGSHPPPGTSPPRACRFRSNRRPCRSPAALPSSPPGARACSRSGSPTASSASSAPTEAPSSRSSARAAWSSTTARASSRSARARRLSSSCLAPRSSESIARTARPLVTGGPIRSALDGRPARRGRGRRHERPLRPCPLLEHRLVSGPAGQRSVGADLSAPPATASRSPPSRSAASAPSGSSLSPGTSRLVAGSPLCQEWVLGRFSSPTRGDGAHR